MRAALVKIQGGVDLINERLVSSNKLHDERYDGTRRDISDLDRRVHKNSGDIMGLQGWKNTVEGERKGVLASGKAIWAVVSLLAGGGGVFAIMEFVK